MLRAERPGRALAQSTEYPDALARVWSALHCPSAGDVLLSAAPGYEFVDWGGPTTSAAAPTGRCTAPTRWARCSGAAPGPTRRDAREQWSLRDVAPMVREHFGLDADPPEADYEPR